MQTPSYLNHDSHDSVRSSDADLLALLRAGDSLTVDDLKKGLGVTATAVRQRLERLLERGLIERQKEVVGRGRPIFRYALTIEGHRHSGADTSVFAEAMWREIMMLRDSPIRRRLISAIARRLGKMYAEEVSGTESLEPLLATKRPLEQQMSLLTNVLLRNQIRASVHFIGSNQTKLPVLDIGSCPYPTLRDHPEDRSLCRMEEEMFSEALGSPVQLTSCRLDGDYCCQFSPVITGATISGATK